MKFRILALALVLAAFVAWGCGAKRQPTYKTAAPAPSLSKPDGTVLVVKASRLNLRSCPGTACQIITVLPKGQELIKLGAKSGWLKVRVQATRKEGWVGARYVTGRGSQPAASPPASQSPPKVKEEWATPKKLTAPQVKEEFAK
jgi:uncharacterized protein YgiM (DUF1202 family)